MELGSPETLAGRKKLFVIDDRLVWGCVDQAIVQSQALPLAIPGDGKAMVATLPIGDDLPTAGKDGKLVSADLRIQLSDPKAIGAVKVRLNGALLTPTQEDPKTGWFVFRPKAEQYRLGDNKLAFRAAHPSPKAKSLANVTHVEVSVIYK